MPIPQRQELRRRMELDALLAARAGGLAGLPPQALGSDPARDLQKEAALGLAGLPNRQDLGPRAHLGRGNPLGSPLSPSDLPAAARARELGVREGLPPAPAGRGGTFLGDGPNYQARLNRLQLLKDNHDSRSAAIRSVGSEGPLGGLTLADLLARNSGSMAPLSSESIRKTMMKGEAALTQATTARAQAGLGSEGPSFSPAAKRARGSS